MNPSRTDRPRMLWFNLASQHRGASAHEQFAADFDIEMANGTTGNIHQDLDMLCVEFDHPDQHGLMRMLELLHGNPGLPLTMLSVQHSEELAVWAFRSGVWEFLALPVSTDEYEHYLRSVQQLVRLRRHNGPLEHLRLPVPRNPSLPTCILRVNRQQLPLYEVLQHLDQHYRERIEEAEMARLCCMSPAHFSRMFKQEFGIGFQDYITRKRMDAALQMLRDTEVPVSSVAYALGYRDPSYFARAFRRHFGYSPSDCRQPETGACSDPAHQEGPD